MIWNAWSVYLEDGLRAVFSPQFLAAAGTGFCAWLLPRPEFSIGLGYLLLSAFVEEVIFRGGLQDILEMIFVEKFIFAPLSPANILASLAFALVHLVHHPPLWALAVFFPSLVFGWFWTRHKNIIPCVAVHAIYNILYFYQPV